MLLFYWYCVERDSKFVLLFLQKLLAYLILKFAFFKFYWSFGNSWFYAQLTLMPIKVLQFLAWKYFVTIFEQILIFGFLQHFKEISETWGLELNYFIRAKTKLFNQFQNMAFALLLKLAVSKLLLF